MTGGEDRGLDTLAGAAQVDRPPVHCQGQALREIAGALGRDQDQGPPPSVTRQHRSNRNGYATMREFSTSSTVIGAPGAPRLKVARGFFAAHSRCTTATIANYSCVKPWVFMQRSTGIV